MSNLEAHIIKTEVFALALMTFSFVIKTVLYYKIEREWDTIRFLYFSQIDLRMTVRKDLRMWRKRQNLLSNLMLIFILLFGISAFFHLLFF